MKENPISFQLKLKPEDFLPATEEEKQSQVIMRESVSFWKDGARRLRKNKVAMVSLVVIILVMIFSFIVPSFYPYNYKEQIKGANNLRPMQYSEEEQARIDAGEKVFPHVFGTDKMGRDYAIRVMMGSRISLLVGLCFSRGKNLVQDTVILVHSHFLLLNLKHPKDKGKRHSLRHKTTRSHCKRLAVALESFHQGINLAFAHRILFGQYGHSIRDFFTLIE